MLDFLILTKDFYEISDSEKGVLRFKNSADVCSFDQMAKIIPELEKIAVRHKEHYPYYAENLEEFSRALVEDRDSAAIEGGPCLFGEHEVCVTVTFKDDTSYLFDYSTGRRYDDEREGEYARNDQDMAEFIYENSQEIKSVHFRNEKTGLTYQEYLHVLLPFAIADALKVKLVVTLPDMSYRKYLQYALKGLDEEFSKQIMAEFDVILYRITDMYIELIEKLKNRYQVPAFTMVHGRDPEIIRLYEEKRKPFIERHKILKSLRSFPSKLESNKDYITMPALPYYLYGSTAVLEINCMEETDSCRKCHKAHKNVMSLSYILFPELLSMDGEHTLYTCKPEFKGYDTYLSELE